MITAEALSYTWSKGEGFATVMKKKVTRYSPVLRPRRRERKQAFHQQATDGCLMICKARHVGLIPIRTPNLDCPHGYTACLSLHASSAHAPRCMHDHNTETMSRGCEIYDMSLRQGCVSKRGDYVFTARPAGRSDQERLLPQTSDRSTTCHRNVRNSTHLHLALPD